MNTYLNSKHQHTTKPIADEVSRRSNSYDAIAQRTMQETADNSLHVKRSKVLQAMANDFTGIKAPWYGTGIYNSSSVAAPHDNSIQEPQLTPEETSTVEEEKEEPLLIHVNIAGSGNNWINARIEHQRNWVKQFTYSHEPTYYRNETKDGRRSHLSFPGPAGSQSKSGFKWAFGAADRGSNSIENLVTQVPDIVGNIIKEQPENATGKEPVKILIVGHSRGAVATGPIAKALKKMVPHAVIELVQFDPVPGPWNEGENLETDVSEINQSCVIYSVATQYDTGFDPQAVYRTKRIIISRQHHSAGLEAGFRYENKVYLGSRLNKLPEGVYADMNENGKNEIPLRRVASFDEAEWEFEKAFASTPNAEFGQDERMRIIKKVLKAFFESRSV